MKEDELYLAVSIAHKLQFAINAYPQGFSDWWVQNMVDRLDVFYAAHEKKIVLIARYVLSNNKSLRFDSH